MFSPNDSRIKQNLPRIKEKLLDTSLVVYFIPSTKLKKELISGSNPLLEGITKSYISVFLENKGLIIQKRMLFEWLEGTLDKKNSYLLSNGEIRIVGGIKNIKDIL